MPIEQVALDPEAADQIAERVKALMIAPHRTEYGEEGIQPKPGERLLGYDTAGLFYGGDDMYTMAGSTDSEVAVNLYIAKKILTQYDADGRPARTWSGAPVVSARLTDVMVKAARKAIGSAPAPVPDFTFGDGGWRKAIDPDRFITKSYGLLRREAAQKAMTSTAGGSGDEWVPTFATAELWKDVHLATEVANNVRRVTMPTNPYTLPTETADVTFRLAPTENTAVTVSNPTTAKATLTAVKAQAEIDFSGELTEDSVVPVISSLRANLVRRGAQTIDDMIVHGDTETGGTGNVNSDDTAPGSDAFYLGLGGMRKFALVTNTAQRSSLAAALSAANFATVRALMLKDGARPSDCVCIMGASTFVAAQTISEVLTLEKYGPSATILRGELGRLYGIPIIIGEAIPGTSTDKTDADGKYTTTTPSSNDTKGWLVIFNRNGWTIGFRRELTIESFRDIQKDQNILVASFRLAQIPSGISTTHTAVGYNITV